MIRLLFSMGFMLCGLIYLTTGVLSYQKNKQSRYRQMFLVLCCLCTGWAISTALMNESEFAARACMFRNTNTLFLSLTYPVLINFILAFADMEKRILKNVLGYLVLYLPGIINIYIYFVQYPYEVTSLRKVDMGWTFNAVDYPTILSAVYMPIFVGGYLFISIIFAFVFARSKFRMKRERISLYILFWAILMLAIMGGMTDLVMPMLGIAEVPPLGMILAIIPIALASMFLKRFAFLNFNVENMMPTILLGIEDGVVLVDNKYQITYVNDGFLSLFGNEGNEGLLRTSIVDILPVTLPKNNKRVFTEELTIKTNGNICYLLTTFSGSFDRYGDFLAGAYVIKNITDLREKQFELESLNSNLEAIVKDRTSELEVEIKNRELAEEKMRYLAYHDHLTGLYNRRAIIEEAEGVLAQRDLTKRHFFIFIDLNKFKLINDTFGHDAGDILLVETANKLTKLFEKACVARTGGDEFLVFWEDAGDVQPQHILKCIEDEFNIPVQLYEHKYRISISCGMSQFPMDGNTVDKLAYKADMAMYKSKKDKDHRFYLYEKEDEF
ncbi:MAG: sensor domain-containing diguanylate cyclase [Anaerovoracaceae bacterium]